MKRIQLDDPCRSEMGDLNAMIQNYIEGLILTSELNLLPASYGGGPIFSTPLFGVSRGNDPIFFKYKEVVNPKHLTPVEMWIRNGLSNEIDLPAKLRIISIVFPFERRIREESKFSKDMPAEIYCVGRNFADDLIKYVLEQTVHYLGNEGYQAVTGVLSPTYQILLENIHNIASTWSERHIAFAAGLGTFSLHEGLITQAGCNIRLASLITDAPLQVSCRTSDDPYTNCLHFTKGICRECIKRCPISAISENGHDKVKCFQYGRLVTKEMTQRLGSILKPQGRPVDGQTQISYPVGCALCQFNVPCMDKNPVMD